MYSQVLVKAGTTSYPLMFTLRKNLLACLLNICISVHIRASVTPSPKTEQNSPYIAVSGRLRLRFVAPMEASPMAVDSDLYRISIVYLLYIPYLYLLIMLRY
jgi:hypothetical protein